MSTFTAVSLKTLFGPTVHFNLVTEIVTKNSLWDPHKFPVKMNSSPREGRLGNLDTKCKCIS